MNNKCVRFGIQGVSRGKNRIPNESTTVRNGSEAEVHANRLAASALASVAVTMKYPNYAANGQYRAFFDLQSQPGYVEINPYLQG